MSPQALAKQMADKVTELLVPFIASASDDMDEFERIRNQIHLAGRDRSSLICDADGCYYAATTTVERINFG